MKFEYILITFLIIFCTIVVFLLAKSNQKTETYHGKIYSDYPDFFYDYEKNGGYIYHPGTGRIQMIEKPKEGTRIFCSYDKTCGEYWLIPVDTTDTSKKYTGGILFGLWGMMTIDPDNYSLKYYLLSPETHQVSEEEFNKAINKHE